MSRESAISRNAASEAHAEGALRGKLKDKCQREPSSGITNILEQAQAHYDLMQPKIAEAGFFLSNAKRRKEGGELDASTYHAEAAPVKVAVCLSSVLRQMLEKGSKDAVKAKTEEEAGKAKLAMLTVLWANGVLYNKMSDSPLMSERTYPANQSLRMALMQARLEKAREIYSDIVGRLEADRIPEQLGIVVPPLQRMLLI